MVCARHALCACLALTASGIQQSHRDQDQSAPFFTHHKTGTGFASLLRLCLKDSVPSCGKRVPEHDTWSGQMPDDCAHDKVVHFVRAPLEVIRSSYLYTRKCACTDNPECVQHEPQLLQPFSFVDPGDEFSFERPRPNETYGHYSCRVSAHDGVVMDMSQASGSRWHIMGMESAYRATRDNPNVLTVCLEEVFHQFDQTVASIYAHLGIEPSTRAKACVAHLNPSASNDFAHGTHDFPAGVRNRVMDIIKDVDANVLGGEFSNLPTSKCASGALTAKRKFERRYVQAWFDKFE